MQDQYTADVNDYLKYSLLRAIQSLRSGPLAVCWMLVADDGGNDGLKLKYLAQRQRFRSIDEPLFDALRALVADGERTTARIEAAKLLPRATYCRELIPRAATDRAAVIKAFLAGVSIEALVLFDPDNGFEIPSAPRVKARSHKHVYWDEVRAAADGGRPVVVYQHFGQHRPWDEHLSAVLARARDELPAHSSVALRGPHGAFMGAAARSEDVEALSAAFNSVATRWGGQVVR